MKAFNGVPCGNPHRNARTVLACDQLFNRSPLCGQLFRQRRADHGASRAAALLASLIFRRNSQYGFRKHGRKQILVFKQHIRRTSPPVFHVSRIGEKFPENTLGLFSVFINRVRNLADFGESLKQRHLQHMAEAGKLVCCKRLYLFIMRNKIYDFRFSYAAVRMRGNFGRDLVHAESAARFPDAFHQFPAFLGIGGFSGLVNQVEIISDPFVGRNRMDAAGCGFAAGYNARIRIGNHICALCHIRHAFDIVFPHAVLFRDIGRMTDIFTSC